MGSADQPPKTRPGLGDTPTGPVSRTVEDWLAARLAEVSGDDADTEPNPHGVELDEEDSATVHDDVAVEERSRARSFGTGRLVARQPILEEETPDPTAVDEDRHLHGREASPQYADPLPPTAPFPVPDLERTTDNEGIQLDPEEDTVGPDADVDLEGGAWDEVAHPPAPPLARGEETNFLLRETDPGVEQPPTDFRGLLPVPGPEELADEPQTQWESRPEIDDDPHTMPQLLDDETRPVDPLPDEPPEHEALPFAPPGRTPAPLQRMQAPPTPDDSLFEEDMPTVVVGPKTVTLPAEVTRSPAPAPLAAPPPAAAPEARRHPPPPLAPVTDRSPMPVAWMLSASAVMAVLLALLVVALVALGLLTPP